MMSTRFIFLLTAVMIFGSAVFSFAGFEEGNTYHGFRLREKRFVKEVNAECYLFDHVQSGARLLKIAADDANKTFSISFKTVPSTDCGTPHVLEHSVLNGSKNFPVKSPFDILSKGSLNTFLNAMTGSDVTLYPVASMNEKDYFNLMHVYLDAVYNPLIYDDPRILKQEGWHYELESEDNPIVYKGVVYNEMKGAFSSPTRELYYRIYKNLFPGNCYGYSSGGYPAAIPRLTREHFLNFHKRHYHPDNSYILLYGDADLDRELAFINDNYLSGYTKSDKPVSIPLQKPFDSVQEMSGYYSAAEGSDTRDQTFLTATFVIGRNTDQALVMALRVLEDVLINQESAPLRLAFQEAGIGKDVSSFVDDVKQNVFHIRVQNANPEDQTRFREILYTTLRNVVRDKLDKEAIEGTINRMEFRLREGDDAQKGLTCNFRILAGWFFADDPFMGLEWEKPLAEVKKALSTDLLESIIQEHMIDNPHTLFFTLEPRPGMEKEINDGIETELAEYKKTLSDAEIDALVDDTQQLIAFQKREDTPEALATIPMLDISDINPEADWYIAEKTKIAGVPVLTFNTFTNDVVYLRLFFDARVLPEALIPYAALLGEILGTMDTQNYSYGDLDKTLNIHTGGFNTSVTSMLVEQDDNQMLPCFIVSSKATSAKVDKMLELSEEIILRTRYSDIDRLKEVLTRHQSRLDADIKQNGFGYTRTRLLSYFSNQGMFNERTQGIDYYEFVTDLTDHFDERSAEIVEKLAQTATLLFSRDHCIPAVTCGESEMQAVSVSLKSFIPVLPESGASLFQWKFDHTRNKEGFPTASKVQYVIQGYDFKKLGYEWNGHMRVLSQVLSRDWLQNQIRVIGGAYGGFSSFSKDGQVYFASYRDPNLKKTLENYNATPAYLETFDVDQTGMTRYIIGTVARMDRPLTPSQKGNEAFQRYLTKQTRQSLQNERDEVLSTTVENIRSMDTMVSELLAKNTFCAVSYTHLRAHET